MVSSWRLASAAMLCDASASQSSLCLIPLSLMRLSLMLQDLLWVLFCNKMSAPLLMHPATCNRQSATTTLVSKSCLLPFMLCSSGNATLRVHNLSW